MQFGASIARYSRFWKDKEYKFNLPNKRSSGRPANIANANIFEYASVFCNYQRYLFLKLDYGSKLKWIQHFT